MIESNNFIRIVYSNVMRERERKEGRTKDETKGGRATISQC